MTQKQIADLIKQKYKESGISDYRIEKDSGVARKTMHRIFSNKDSRISSIIKLANYFGIEINAEEITK